MPLDFSAGGTAVDFSTGGQAVDLSAGAEPPLPPVPLPKGALPGQRRPVGDQPQAAFEPIGAAVKTELSRPLATEKAGGPFGVLARSLEAAGIKVPRAALAGTNEAIIQALTEVGVFKTTGEQERARRELGGLEDVAAVPVPEAGFGRAVETARGDQFRSADVATTAQADAVREQRQQSVEQFKKEAANLAQTAQTEARFRGVGEAAAAQRQAGQQRTAQTLGAARETVTAPTWTPADLGPQLTGKVNLARYRSSQAPTDRFTIEDLENAGLDPEHIEKLTTAQHPTLTALKEGEKPAAEAPPAPVVEPKPVKAPEAAAKPAAAPAPSYGAGNRIVTKNAADAARERLKKSAGTFKAGIDPQDLADLAIIGAHHIEAGAREFGRWAGQMQREFGDAIKPHLKLIWSNAQQHLNQVSTEGPLSRPAALTDPEEFTRQLYALEGSDYADAAEIKHKLDDLPKGIQPSTWESMTHHEDNPAVEKLTPDAQRIYDEHVKPITEETNKNIAEIKGHGWAVPKEWDQPDQVGGTPRYVAGRTRSYGEALKQWASKVAPTFTGGPSRHSLSTSFSGLKHREFFKAVNQTTGDEMVVHVSHGQVQGFDGTGTPASMTKSFTGPIRPGAKFTSHGEEWKLESTTMKQIESVTRVRYLKNLMANRLDTLAKSRAALRRSRFIKSMTESPDWETPDPASKPGMAVRISEHATPPETRGRLWRRPTLPQFSQWYVEPRIADALDDFAREMRSPEGFETGLLKIGKVMNAVMFINPKYHIDNVFNHMLVARGLVGNVMQAPSSLKYLYRAFHEVLTAGPEYRRYLRQGLSLPYARYLTPDLHQSLISQLGVMSKQNPGLMRQLAARFGYPDTKTMLKRLGSIPSRSLWIASDVMTLSRAMQLAERGSLLRGARGVEGAINETMHAMPSYRVPGTLVTEGKGGRALREIFANPAWGRFGRYQLNRLALYAHDVKEALNFANKSGWRQNAEAIDRLAMLGVYTYLVYPYVWDPMYRWMSGNPNASAVRSGASTIPQAVTDTVQGKRDPGTLAQTAFTLGIPMQLPVELYMGRTMWNGEPILRAADMRARRFRQMAKDALSYAFNQFSTVGQFLTPEGRAETDETLWRAAGVVSRPRSQEQIVGGMKRAEERAARRKEKHQPHNTTLDWMLRGIGMQ